MSFTTHHLVVVPLAGPALPDQTAYEWKAHYPFRVVSASSGFLKVGQVIDRHIRPLMVADPTNYYSVTVQTLTMEEYEEEVQEYEEPDDIVAYRQLLAEHFKPTKEG